MTSPRCSASGKVRACQGRQINAEVGTLRAILRHYGRWAHISHRVKMLRQRTDVGKALTHHEERRLLDAIRESRSLSLLPLFVLSLDAGLRPSEIRSLRRHDLHCSQPRCSHSQCGGVDEIVVPRSKTEARAGQGRAVNQARA